MKWLTISTLLFCSITSSHASVNTNAFTTPKHTVQNKSEKIYIQAGSKLSDNLTKWGRSNGYSVIWKSQKDFIVPKDIYLESTNKEQLLETLGKLFSSELYGLRVKLYTGNNVIVIESI